jgi:hypothetical protein
MKVEITIETGNEAMLSRDDIADALVKVAESFRHDGKYYYPIMDANGNKVGEFNISCTK